ncbi:hypothetical protein [Parasphingorhabdus sp.]|uniref:hypothetical protein n=1 Tax=Parasphingorhabdus sp. TaxID=2709688 RepID=UPI003001C8A6
MKKTVTIEDKRKESLNREAELTTRSLGTGKQETAIDHLFDAARNGTAEQRKLFSGRKAEELGVGLHNEKIVWESGLDD